MARGKSRSLNVMKPDAKLPEWGAHSPYGFDGAFGGDAVLFSSKDIGLEEGAAPLISQHPMKAQHHGGHMKWFGDDV